MREEWRRVVPDSEAARRAGGRRRYNAARQRQARTRRRQVKRWLAVYGARPGLAKMLAQRLGVSVSTVRRDLQAVRAEAPLPLLCPECGLPRTLAWEDPNIWPPDTDTEAWQALETAMAHLLPTGDLSRLAGPRRHDRLTPRALPFGV
jgi:hypothetical protein